LARIDDHFICTLVFDDRLRDERERIANQLAGGRRQGNI